MRYTTKIGVGIAWILTTWGLSEETLWAQAAAVAPPPSSQMLGLIVTPLLSGIVAVIGAFVAIRFDARKAINQELIKKRILIYDNVVPKLNDLLCFFLSQGAWKSLSPPLMIQRKRELDQTMYIYGPLFRQEIFNQYKIFIELCFDMYTGVGRDARFRVNRSRLQNEWGAEWKPEWDGHFVPAERIANHKEVKGEYERLLALFAEEIGAQSSSASETGLSRRTRRAALRRARGNRARGAFKRS